MSLSDFFAGSTFISAGTSDAWGLYFEISETEGEDKLFILKNVKPQGHRPDGRCFCAWQRRGPEPDDGRRQRFDRRLLAGRRESRKYWTLLKKATSPDKAVAIGQVR